MTAEARPDESTHGKVMHAAIQSGDHKAIARYRDAFPILEPFSDAAIQEGATPHNCSIALARERGFEGPYHLNRCFSENISVAPRETFEALKEAVKALDLEHGRRDPRCVSLSREGTGLPQGSWRRAWGVTSPSSDATMGKGRR